MSEDGGPEKAPFPYPPDCPVDSSGFKPWPLMENKVQRKSLLKACEEISELQIELSKLLITLQRLMMQGLDDIDPSSGEHNLDRVQKEIGDVKACLKILVENLELDKEYIRARSRNKYMFLKPLHDRTPADRT